MKKNEEKIKEKTDADRSDEMFRSYRNLEKKTEGGYFHYKDYNSLTQIIFIDRINEIINENQINEAKSRINNCLGKQKTDSIKEKINFIESEYKRIVNQS